MKSWEGLNGSAWVHLPCTVNQMPLFFNLFCKDLRKDLCQSLFKILKIIVTGLTWIFEVVKLKSKCQHGMLLLKSKLSLLSLF